MNTRKALALVITVAAFIAAMNLVALATEVTPWFGVAVLLVAAPVVIATSTRFITR